MLASKNYDIAFKLGAKLNKNYSNTFKLAENIAGKTVGKIAKTAAAIGGTVLSVNAVKESIGEAISYESAMADVAKTVEGLKNPTGELTDEYHKMSEELLNMTSYLPMTGEELAKITAAAGQAGITDNLTKFTEDAAKMGIAFDTTAEQAGDWMAVWRTSFKMNQNEVTTLADQINYLGNTSSENALKLSGVVSRIGSLGEISGISAAEIAAMASGMTGVSEEISATGIKNLMKATNAGSAATKKQIAVLDKLGFSATGMANRMQTDAQGAILDLLGAFEKLPDAEKSAALTNYFGSESVAAIAPLVNNLGNLKDQFEKVGNASIYAGSMEDEFSTRANTTENKIKLAKNAIDRFQISLGNLALPIVAKGANLFSDAMAKITSKIPLATEKAKELYTLFKDRFEPAMVSLKDRGINAFNALKENVLSAFENIKNVGITTFNNLAKVVQDNQPVFDKVVEIALDIGAKLSKAFEVARPAIEWIFTEGLPRITGIFLEIVDGATNIYNCLDRWSLIEPIIAGIVAGFVTFKAALAITATINGIVTSVKALTTALTIQGAVMKGSAVTQAIAVIGMKAYAVASGLLKGQLTLQAAATGMATAFQTAFNIVMAANPISLIVIGIVALVAAIVAATVLIIKNWDKIKTFFAALWESIKNIFSGIGNWFKERFSLAKTKITEVFIGLGNWFNEKVITPIMNFFVPIVNFIVGLFSIIWESISAIWCTVATWFDINVIQPIVSFFSGLWQNITSFFQNAWNGVVMVWNAASEWFNTNVVQPLVSFFSNLSTSISEFFQNAWDSVVSIWASISTWFDENVIAPIVDLFKGIVNKISQVGLDISSKLREIFTSPIDFIKDKWNGIKSFFSGLLGDADKIAQKGEKLTGLKTTPASVANYSYSPIKGFATGTNYTPDTFIAGEKGAELITNASGRKVYDAFETGRIFNNVSQYENLNILDDQDSPQLQELKTFQTNVNNSTNQAPITIDYNPQIKIEGSGGDEAKLKALINEALRLNAEELKQLVVSIMSQAKSREERMSNA